MTNIHQKTTRWFHPLPGKSLLFFFLLFMVSVPLPSGAKVYIDITSPGVTKLPIAIPDFQGTSGKEIADIIRDDLVFTGLFMYIDKSSYIETAAQQFNAMNWKPLGIEAVVKGSVAEAKNLTITVRLYDAFEGKEIFAKEYQAERDLLRQVGHGIANDIYAAFTGKNGIFRTRIAFVAEDDNEKGIYIMDWDGYKIRKLGLRGTLVLTPHWSHDGTKLLYSSERSRQWGIYLLDFLKMTEKRVFVSKGTNMAGDFFPNPNSFTFSSSKEGTPDIFVHSIDSGSTKRISSSFGIDVSPAVSPDGSLIAFVSDRGGSPQIYLMRSDGTEVRRVSFEGSYNTSPTWSPNGDRIVFSGRRGGKNQIFLIKPDGSELQQLTDHGNNEDPSFSPDGRYITFSSDREKAREKAIYIMRANGEAQKRITPKGLNAFSPRWSPN